MNRKQTCSPEACAIACVSPDDLPDNPIWAGDHRDPSTRFAPSGQSLRSIGANEQVEACSTENPDNESEADGSTDESPEHIGPGRKRRSLMFHILYALDAHNYEASIPSIIDIFNRGFEQTIEVDGQEQKSCEAIIAAREEIDEFLKPLLANWRLERVGVCTRLILRIATWELLHTDTDPRVVLNEAIELAKCFAERDAYRFVNGVLDEALKRLGKQPVEQKAEESAQKPENPEDNSK